MEYVAGDIVPGTLFWKYCGGNIVPGILYRRNNTGDMTLWYQNERCADYTFTQYFHAIAAFTPAHLHY